MACDRCGLDPCIARDCQDVLKMHRDEFVLVDNMSYREVYESLMEVVRELLLLSLGGEKSNNPIPVCCKDVCYSLAVADVLLWSGHERDDGASSTDSEPGDQEGADVFLPN